MYKIGLITTSHAINYGAVLQAFSLKKAIEENTHTTVEVINYCADEGIAGRKVFRKNTDLKSIIINIFSAFKFRYRRNRKVLFKLFDDFKTNYLGISSKLVTKKSELMALNGFDTIVCGSDQLWNLNLFDDPAFFLDFVKDNVNKVAYAVSISDNVSDAQMKIIAERCSDFSAISIREYDDAQRLERVMGRHIDNIIDPVFLHNSNEWKKLLSVQIKNTEPYVFIFLISHQSFDRSIVDMIRENRKTVVLNLHPVSYIVADEEINVCSPNKFVEYIANADVIITDSFHCTAFAVIFNKVFYNIKRATRNNRIENLYKLFSLNSRFVDYERIPSKFIDYSEANLCLKREVSRGRSFIIENIGDKL